MGQEIILTWTRIGKFTEFNTKLIADKKIAVRFSSPGIYLWTELIDGKEVINYVGKSNSNLIARNLEHFSYFLSLDYSIPKIYREENNRYVRSYPKKYPLEKGYYAVLDQKSLNEKERLALLDQVFKYLANLQIYFAPIEFDSNPDFKKTLANIESQLIYDFAPIENNRSTATQYDYFEFVHKYAEGLKIQLHNLKEESVKVLEQDKTRPSKRPAKFENKVEK